MPRPTPPRSPSYDRSRLRAGILHLGIGGFHRAHMAKYLHDLMRRDHSALDWGVIAAGLRAQDRPLIDALNAQGGLYTLVERDQHGEQRDVVGAILRAVDGTTEIDELIGIGAQPATRVISLTVTEHGYCLDPATKRLDPSHPAIARDLTMPDEPSSAIGVIAAILSRRRSTGAGAVTILSCDNIQHNGDVTAGAARTFAALVDPALVPWIDANVTFPNAMVDRITPQPSPDVVAALRDATGTDDAAPLIAERFRQWVVEDRFAAGRPSLDHVGVRFVADVAPFERMKLRLLNASHLALAGPAQLLGIATVADAIADPVIAKFVRALMDRETGPSVGAVEGVDLEDYKAKVVERFANPAISDTVARINADAPLNYLLDPLRERLVDDLPIDLLAGALAFWLRRVRGVDERGRPIETVHPSSSELRRRAIAGGSDPGPLLEFNPLFGDLGRDRRCVAAVAEWLRLIDDAGSRGAILTILDKVKR